LQRPNQIDLLWITSSLFFMYCVDVQPVEVAPELISGAEPIFERSEASSMFIAKHWSEVDEELSMLRAQSPPGQQLPVRIMGDNDRGRSESRSDGPLRDAELDALLEEGLKPVSLSFHAEDSSLASTPRGDGATARARAVVVVNEEIDTSGSHDREASDQKPFVALTSEVRNATAMELAQTLAENERSKFEWYGLARVVASLVLRCRVLDGEFAKHGRLSTVGRSHRAGSVSAKNTGYPRGDSLASTDGGIGSSSAVIQKSNSFSSRLA
jgi:hypothetical protein